MKKRIGIVTVYGENNFGNKLQNYASVKIYEELGLEVNTLRVMQSRMIINSKEKMKINSKKIVQYLPKYKYLKYQFSKENKFKQFSIRKLNITDLYNTSNIKSDLLEQYDYLSVGSDQVWNDTDFDYNDMKYFSLVNVKSPKIIALSPSMGKTSLLEENKYILKEALENYSAISCREKAGAEYIEKLINKECKVLVDPTMALTSTDWKAIERKPEWLGEKKYAMCYFLGGMEENREYITKVCNKRNIEFIDILDKKSKAYNTSPEEFIYLIHNADVVFTDSFHACVFSIIFDKDFAVFKRQNQESEMGSRIDTLFNLFGMENYEYTKIYNFNKLEDKEKILEKKRNEVLLYLKNVLEFV